MSIFNVIMAFNFDRPEIDILCDLVWHGTGYRIPPTRVKFGIPKELDARPDIEDDANSFIPASVDVSFDSRMSKTVSGFLFTRVPLGALPIVPNSPITPPSLPFKTSDILSQINRQLATRLTMKDLEEDTYTVATSNVVIRAKVGSKNWIGKRNMQVTGIRDSTMLFPNDLIYGWMAAQAIASDKKGQLTDYANRDNSTSWTRMVDFNFGTIEESLIGNSGRNTRVYIHSLKPGYRDQWLYFVRIDPKTINDHFFPSKPPKVVVPRTKFKVHDILPQINEALNLNLSIDDVENTEHLPGLKQYPIRFLKSSIGWLPGVYTMDIVVEEIKFANLRLTADDQYRLSGPGAYRTYA